jgi:hypothetical protein
MPCDYLAAISIQLDRFAFSSSVLRAWHAAQRNRMLRLSKRLPAIFDLDNMVAVDLLPGFRASRIRAAFRILDLRIANCFPWASNSFEAIQGDSVCSCLWQHERTARADESQGIRIARMMPRTDSLLPLRITIRLMLAAVSLVPRKLDYRSNARDFGKHALVAQQ